MPRLHTAKMASYSTYCVLGSFTSQVRGIKLYDFETTQVHVEDSLVLHLEPANTYDANAIAVFTVSPPKMLGHLAREKARHLAPLLSSGLEATG